MSKSEPLKLKEEIERGFQFLTTLDQNGEVYKAIFTLLSDLRNKAGKDDQPLMKSGVTDTGIDGNPTRQDHETILIAIHKAMCEEKFICIYEKPSSVPGFSAPIKGTVLPEKCCREENVNQSNWNKASNYFRTHNSLRAATLSIASGMERRPELIRPHL